MSNLNNMRVNEAAPVAKTVATKFKEKLESGEFSFTLNKLSSEGLAKRLEGLLTDITAWGKRIAEHPDIADLKRYRGMIGDFMNEVITNAYEFSRENFLDRRGRHRVYGIVRQVNKELDELAQELLAAEKDHIAILYRIDQIQGLLLDMFI